MISSRAEIRSHVLSVTRQDNTQIGTLVNEFINRTIAEINDPAWAGPKGNHSHLWNWLRAKKTFTTTASTADYVMGHEVDRIALMRQTTTPTKLIQLRDEDFFEYVPDPTTEGNPRFYRIWETEGVSTRLSSADTIEVLSSSSSDAGSDELAVTVMGYSGGIWRTEVFTLNGTAVVSGSITFDARELFVSKQKNTTGSITVRKATGDTTLVTLGPEDRAPKFKVISLYPIPSAAITMYLEYYKYLKPLNNDSDVPGLHEKYHWIIVLGTLYKVYQYLNNELAMQQTYSVYKNAVWGMVSSDKIETDIVDSLKARNPQIRYREPEREDEAQI